VPPSGFSPASDRPPDRGCNPRQDRISAAFAFLSREPRTDCSSYSRTAHCAGIGDSPPARPEPAGRSRYLCCSLVHHISPVVVNCTSWPRRRLMAYGRQPLVTRHEPPAGVQEQAVRPGAGTGRDLRKLARDLENAHCVRDPCLRFVTVDGKPCQLVEGSRVQDQFTRGRDGDLGSEEFDMNSLVIKDRECL
jgi:hypothetical protein